MEPECLRESTYWKRCRKCAGSGLVRMTAVSAVTTVDGDVLCPTCGGHGALRVHEFTNPQTGEPRVMIFEEA